MIALEIDASSAAQLARAWAHAPELFDRELKPAVLEAELYLQREIVERTPVGASGGSGLRASFIAADPRIEGGVVIGEVGTPLAYAEPVELGTRPHMPPVQPLIDWARVKLGVTGDEARGVGFAVARKIAAEGTEGAFMVRRTFDEHGAHALRIVAGGVERVIAAFEALGGGGRA